MKICFITTHFDGFRGGNEVFVNLFREMRGEHEFFLVTSKISGPEPSSRFQLVPFRSRTYFYSYNEAQFSKKVLEVFPELLKKEKFDLILINQVIGRSIAGLKKFDIPIVYMIHHPVSVDINLAISETPEVVEKIKWMFKYGQMKNVQKKLVSEFDNILTVSESSRKQIEQDYHTDTNKIKVIYNGIDTEFYKKVEPTVPKTVLTVGSYQHPRRGFKYLKEVYQKLSDRGFSIMDVGRRTEGQEKELQSISGVTAYGIVKKEDLPSFYSRTSVFISTSLYEGFGLSLVEALACETPALGFNVPGVSEVLGVIDSKLVCHYPDTDEMVRKVLELDNERDDAQRKQYRQKVIENFSLQKMVNDYRNLFNSF